MLTSYAQNFEDVMLWRALGMIERGFYIDVGAQHPVNDSISLAFYERGWRGVHVEPVPANAQALRDGRPDEEVIEAAVSQSSEPITIFAIADTGLSTGDKDIAERHSGQGLPSTPVQVPTMRLSDILDKHADRDIHWLKIDVEGMERDVIASWSPSEVRPWVLCVEATRPRSPEPDFESWEPLLFERGYIYVYFDGLNRFYVHESHKELDRAFQAPPNVFDEFALAKSPYADQLNASLHETSARLQQSEAEVGRLHHHIAAVEGVQAERKAELGRLHDHIVTLERAQGEERGALTERASAYERHYQLLAEEVEGLRASKAKTDLAHARLRSSLTTKLAAARTQSRHLSGKVDSLERNLFDLQGRLDDNSRRPTGVLQDHFAQHARQWAEVQDALQRGERQTAELNRQNEQLLNTITTLSEQGVLRTSWKGARSTLGFVFAIPRRVVRFAGAHALAWLRMRPRAMSVMRRSLQRIPTLERRLLSFAAARPRQAVSIDDQWSLEPQPEALLEWRRLFGLRKE